MSVALRTITRLQDADDINVNLGAGVDEYALCWDNDTARFVLRAPAAPFAGLLATGATVGATAQAQAFTNGIVGPSWKPGADSTTGLTFANASGSPLFQMDTVHGTFALGETPHSNAGLVLGCSLVGELPYGNATVFYTGTARLAPRNSFNAYHVYAGNGTIDTETANTIALAAAFVAAPMAKAGSGTISTTYGLYVSPSTVGVSNYAAYFGGSVGIGTPTPSAQLDISADAGAIVQLKTASNAIGVGDILGKLQFWTSDLSGNAAGVGAYLAAVGGDAYGEDTDLVFATAHLPGSNAASERLRIRGLNGNVGIGDTAPAEKLDVTGNANVTGVYKVDDVQVLSNRVIDARCADVANSGDATTDGLIDALRDAMIAHGLIAAA